MLDHLDVAEPPKYLLNIYLNNNFTSNYNQLILNRSVNKGRPGW